MENKSLKRGDIEIENGVEWFIAEVSYREGAPKYSRVRVGSIAHSILTEGDTPIESGTDGGSGGGAEDTN